MGATFMKLGRAPTTLMTFNMSSKFKVQSSRPGHLPLNFEPGTLNLKTDDARAARAAQLAREGVSGVHDELGEPAHTLVVDPAVIRDDDAAVGRAQLLVGERDGLQGLAPRLGVGVVEAQLCDERVVVADVGAL